MKWEGWGSSGGRGRWGGLVWLVRCAAHNWASSRRAPNFGQRRWHGSGCAWATHHHCPLTVHSLSTVLVHSLSTVHSLGAPVSPALERAGHLPGLAPGTGAAAPCVQPGGPAGRGNSLSRGGGQACVCGWGGGACQHFEAPSTVRNINSAHLVTTVRYCKVRMCVRPHRCTAGRGGRWGQ